MKTLFASEKKSNEMPNPAEHDSGFAMIEAMLSSALLLLALENALATVSVATRLLEHQNRLTEASQASQLFLEQLMLAIDTDADLAPGAHTALLNRDGGRVAADGIFQADWTVTPNAPFPRILQMDVTLTWQESHSAVRSMVFQTFRN